VEFKQWMYINDKQEVVTVTEVTQTPAEFLAANSQVYGFAQQMRPGAMLDPNRKQLT